MTGLERSRTLPRLIGGDVGPATGGRRIAMPPLSLRATAARACGKRAA
jgi:hypothetical protein